jgi:hypothetical protein
MTKMTLSGWRQRRWLRAIWLVAHGFLCWYLLTR